MDAPDRYQTIPKPVEAIQWDGGNKPAIREFAGDKAWFDPSGVLYVYKGPDAGPQVWQPIFVGAWIVRWAGSNHEYWTLGPITFEENYEPEPKQGRQPDKRVTKKAAAKKATKKAGGST